MLAKKKHWIWFGAITVLLILSLWKLVLPYTSMPGLLWHRLELIGLVYAFLILHCFLDVTEMYAWIYRHRVILAIALFCFLVANCYTYSSVSMYEAYIQPNHLSQYGSPIFGSARAIRSDEWLVNISRIIAGSFNHFGATNDIVRGTLTSGISATGGFYFDYSALRAPSTWGYYLFDVAYGNSFYWNFLMVFGALLSFELCMILTKGKKLYSVLGCVLIWFSSFNLWWSICGIMFAAIAIVVLFYYMVKAKNWKKRLLFGTMLAFAGTDFCTNLYPAWQVPFGWVVLTLIVWIVITNQEWKKYHVLDWLVIAVDILFMASIILRFIQVDAEYMLAVTSTVYPGKRVSYGGYILNKLFGYAPSVVMPIVEIGNAPETGTFFGTFPLGLILGAYVLKKDKWKNSLIWCLLVPTVLLLVYCTSGLPPILSKLFLLTNSTSPRAVDALGFVVTLMFIASMAEMDQCGRLNAVWSIAITILSAALALWSCYGAYSTKSLILIAAILAVTSVGIYFFIHSGREHLRQLAVIGTSFVLCANSLLINPITVGFSAITEKPLYTEVRNILAKNQEHTLWIGIDNLVNSSYLISCGAPTLNSTNYIPNKELWKVLDPKDENEQTWNRYAHIAISLTDDTESKITLAQADMIKVDLCVKDFQTLNIDYVLGGPKIPSSYQSILKQVYNDDGSAIYQVIK